MWSGCQIPCSLWSVRFDFSRVCKAGRLPDSVLFVGRSFLRFWGLCRGGRPCFLCGARFEILRSM